MAGRVRMAVVLGLAAVFTPLVAGTQAIILKTGLARPTRMPQIWFRLLVRVLGLRVRTHGLLAAERPLMLAANHISWIDIVALGSVGEISFVARGDMVNWPVMGTLAKLGKCVFVDRKRRSGTGRQAGELAGRLASGNVVALFAEGTTGDGNRLLPFKSALFGAAEMLFDRDSATPPSIQPVAIAYTRDHGMAMGRMHRMRASWIGDEDLAPHLRDYLGRDVFDIDIHFCEPFRFAADMDRKDAAHRTERAVRDALAGARAPRR